MRYLYKPKIVNLRERKHITQAEIAKLLGFHENAYGQFEREDTILPIEHLNSLCNFFNVSIDYIFDFTDIENYKDNKKDIKLDISKERLKEFRKENKLTQEKLGEILSLTKSSISKYEKGIYIISTSSLYAICKKYNISADYLLGKIDSPKYLK